MNLLGLALGRRGLGWKPDKPDERDFSHTLLGLKSEDPGRASVSLKPFMPKIGTQGPTSSCVGWATRHALSVCAAQAVTPTPVPPSARFIYYHGRRFDATSGRRFDATSGGPNTPDGGPNTPDGGLRDVGCTIRSACKGLTHAGVPDETLMPWSVLSINTPPSWKAYMGAFARRQGNYYRIFTPRNARGAAIREALATGHPVVFGAIIDKAFLADDGPEVVDAMPPEGARVGGHCMCLVGFNYSSTHGWLYEVANSWGTVWRRDGYAFLTERFVCSPDVSAPTIIDGWF